MATLHEMPMDRLEQAIARQEQALKQGGGPPYDGGMDTARVDKLESFAERTGERLTRVEEKLDHLLKEVGQFKWWLVGAILTIILTVFGTGVAIQQMTVATFQAAGAQANPTPPAAPPIIINIPAQPAAPAPK